VSLLYTAFDTAFRQRASRRESGLTGAHHKHIHRPAKKRLTVFERHHTFGPLKSPPEGASPGTGLFRRQRALTS
jgi:hypothetical protein